MKKKTAMILAAVLLCTGCQNGNAENSSVTSTAEATSSQTETDPAAATSELPTEEEQPVTAEQTEEPVIVPGSTKTVFKPGVWRGEDSYFFFHEDNSGQLLSFENGIGVGFQVEQPADDGTVTFHMGAADNNSVFALSDVSEDSFTLTTDDGQTDTLVYVCEGDDNTFRFYTDEELQQIALNYYQAQTGYAPQYSGIKSNNDGTATIQLFDQVDDHNSTSAWYTIDRVTLKGTDDMLNEEVDMSEFAQ